MADLTTRQLAFCVAGAVLMVVLGLSQLRRGGGDPVAATSKPARIAVDETGGRGRLVIHVAGAVRRPGVYRLAAGARVDDAVELVELLGRRRVEVERDALGRRAGDTRRAAHGHHHLTPVLDFGGEVERREVGPPPRAARAADGVDDPRARGQAIHAGPAHGTRHVDGHPRLRAVALLPHPDGRRRGTARLVIAAGEVARAQQDDHDHAERPQGQDVTRSVRHARRR